METQEFIGRSHLDIPTLNAWVEAEWLMPVTSRRKFLFSEADLARARLIQDLKVDFGVNDEGVAIILHLLDQLYGLRCLVRDIHAMETPDRAKDAG
jgi:chaperone modulatory protein CbpM